MEKVLILIFTFVIVGEILCAARVSIDLIKNTIFQCMHSMVKKTRKHGTLLDFKDK